MMQKAHVPPSSRRSGNSSPTDLPARKKHSAVLPQLLNADLIAQIIGTETIADVIIDDAEACALLDSGATVDLMTSIYAEARGYKTDNQAQQSICEPKSGTRTQLYGNGVC